MLCSTDAKDVQQDSQCSSEFRNEGHIIYLQNYVYTAFPKDKRSASYSVNVENWNFKSRFANYNHGGRVVTTVVH